MKALILMTTLISGSVVAVATTPAASHYRQRIERTATSVQYGAFNYGKVDSAPRSTRRTSTRHKYTNRSTTRSAYHRHR